MKAADSSPQENEQVVKAVCIISGEEGLPKDLSWTPNQEFLFQTFYFLYDLDL